MKLSHGLLVLLLAAVVAAIVYTRKDKRDTHRSPPQTGDPEPEWGGDSPPPPEPGDVIVYELAAAPATHYGRADSTDDPYRELASETAAGRARYDSNLSDAAAESAYQGAVHGRPPAEAVSSFILHAAGAPDASAARYSLRTNDESDDVVARALSDALRDPPGGDGELFVGVGEAATPQDAHTRHVVVLMTRRTYALHQAPRSAPLRSTWSATGELPPGYADAVAHALYPDGRLEEIELRVREDRFEIRLDTGSEVGVIAVGIDGVGRTGPGKLLQLSVDVGRPTARRYELVVPPGDPPFADRAAAEAHAFALLAADRAAHGASTLELDPELTAIARAHSEDMQRAGFFGHRSPTTGLAADRVRGAGVRVRALAENLAKNDSLAEAENSLLMSVGHRANLLSNQFSHVGVGLASAVERGRTEWYVTQIFARPVEDVDEDALADRVLEILASRRDGLAVDATLGAVAQDGADLASRGDTDSLADRLGRRARRESRRGVTVSVQVIYAEDQLELPASLSTDSMSVVGVGVAQSASDPSGRIGVVVIAGQ